MSSADVCVLRVLCVLFVLRSVDVVKPTVSSDEEEDEALETLKFNFNIEALGLVLYGNDSKQVSGFYPGSPSVLKRSIGVKEPLKADGRQTVTFTD